jgi:hypothetical protein
VLELDCGFEFDPPRADRDFFPALPAKPAVCLIETAGGVERRWGAALAGLAGAGFELAPIPPGILLFPISPNYKIPPISFHPLHFRVSRSND